MNIYNNRLFKHFYEKEKEAAKKLIESIGTAIENTEKYEGYINNNAKFSYWLVIILTLLILYSIIKKFF